MPTKTPLTVAEHEEFGAVLTALRNELLERRVRLHNAHARTGPDSAPANQLGKAIAAIDEARSLLDRCLFRDHPQQARPGIYYPVTPDAVVVRRDDVQALIMATDPAP